ncbi:MAG: amino acid ABC transporter substrate-binding protein [Clostridia bacterium]|nr:amino acid ABC transporter substrate-binding protein [Clostridia bacterium]
MFRTQLRKAAILITVIALYCCAFSGLSAAEGNYVENEKNFVDESMDVTHGIPENATGVLDRIRRSGVLRVATEPYFPPQEFIDPNGIDQKQYVGADMELARLIAKRMGVELQIIPMEFSKVLPALTEDQADLTISAISFTPSRANAWTMSKGYYYADSTANTVLIVRGAEKERYTDLEMLADKTLIAQSSSVQEALAAAHIAHYKEFRRVSAIQTVYDMVAQGRADAGIVDMDTAENYIKNNPESGLALAENLHFDLEEQYQGDRIAAKKGETQLIYFVNGVIDEVLADGTYMKWIEEAQKRADELGM